MRAADSLHPSSSLWSPQSLSPSHCHCAGMQVHSPNALTAHVKWFLPHEHSVLLWTPAHRGWKGGKSDNTFCFLIRRNIKVIFFCLMWSVTVNELQTTEYCYPMEHRPGAFTIYVLMVCAETFFHSDGAINMPDSNIDGPHKINLPCLNIKLEV